MRWPCWRYCLFQEIKVMGSTYTVLKVWFLVFIFKYVHIRTLSVGSLQHETRTSWPSLKKFNKQDLKDFKAAPMKMFKLTIEHVPTHDMKGGAYSDEPHRKLSPNCAAPLGALASFSSLFCSLKVTVLVHSFSWASLPAAAGHCYSSKKFW